MDQNLKFCFYSVLKEEDAEPFAADGLLAVADGLGGTGRTVHVLDDRYYEKKNAGMFRKEIYKRAFPEYDKEEHEWLSGHLERWLNPMTDGVPDTSALWGSRIVLARFVFALFEKEGFLESLDDETARANLSEFITKGLVNTAEKLKLQPGIYEKQKLLPSTLAAVSYYSDGESLSAEAVWAGDSRVYAWTADGLKQLTTDDSDSLGAITNLFSADGAPAVLNYARYDLPLPCVLMAVTDGVFHSADNDLLVKLLERRLKESNSIDGFASALQVYFDNNKLDDASGAFAPVGFGSFLEFKEKMTPRSSEEEYKYALSFVSDPGNCLPATTLLMRDNCPSGVSVGLYTAFSELKKAGQDLASAKTAFDGHCGIQNGIMELEKGILDTLAKRREDIRKEHIRIAQEKSENSEKQKEIYHVKMPQLDEKIRYLRGECKRLTEFYRKSCNPRVCSVCDPRCQSFLSHQGDLTDEIRTRRQERSECVSKYNALRDKYLKLHSDLGRLDNKDRELEREDFELQRLMQEYEDGKEIIQDSYKTGFANSCAGRFNVLGDRSAVSENITESEKLVADKSENYIIAVKAFDENKTEIIKKLDEFFDLAFIKTIEK